MGWLRNRWATLLDALTLRRAIALPLVIAVVTALIRLAPVIARAEGAPMFLGVPAWTWGLVGGLILLIYFLIEYATRKRIELQPQFDFSFPASGLGIVAAIDREVYATGGGLQYGPPFDTRYVRILIESQSGMAIRDCVAGIIGLAKRRQGETNFVNIDVPQTLFLEKEPFTVYPEMPRAVDFLRTDERDNKLRPSPNVPWPRILENIFDDCGTYRFTITVHGGGISRRKPVEIDWTDQWDAITGR